MSVPYIFVFLSVGSFWFDCLPKRKALKLFLIVWTTWVVGEKFACKLVYWSVHTKLGAHFPEMSLGNVIADENGQQNNNVYVNLHHMLENQAKVKSNLCVLQPFIGSKNTSIVSNKDQSSESGSYSWAVLSINFLISRLWSGIRVRILAKACAFFGMAN